MWVKGSIQIQKCMDKTLSVTEWYCVVDSAHIYYSIIKLA